MLKNYKENLDEINEILKERFHLIEYEEHKKDFFQAGGLKTLKSIDVMDDLLIAEENNIEEELDTLKRGIKFEDNDIDELDLSLFQNYDPESALLEILEDKATEMYNDWKDFLSTGIEGVVLKESEAEEYQDLNDHLQQLDKDIKKQTKLLSEINLSSRSLEDNARKVNSEVKTFNSCLNGFNEKEKELEENEQDFDSNEDDENEEYLKERYEESLKEKEEAEKDWKDALDDVDTEYADIFDKFKEKESVRINFYSELNCLVNDIRDFGKSALPFLSKVNNDFCSLQNDIYINSYKDMNKLNTFINQVAARECIKAEYVVPNKGVELNKIIIFEDNSIAFRDKENKPFKLNKDSKESIKFFCENIIDYELRKTPKWTSTFKKLFNEFCMEKYNGFDEVLEGITLVKQYNNLLKDVGFDFNKYDKYEDFRDNIDQVIRDANLKKMINGFFSQKYKKLVNEDTYAYFKTLMENDIPKKTIKEQLINKLAVYDTSEDFNESLRKLSYSLLNWSVNELKVKMEGEKINIIEEGEESLIIKINDFSASKKLGSQSWCISTGQNFFNSYTNKSEQYFVYDFKRDPKQNESMMGITLNNNTGYTTGHLKDDSRIPTGTQDKWIISIILNNETIENKGLITPHLKKLAKHDKDEFLLLYKKYAAKIKQAAFTKSDLKEIDTLLNDENFSFEKEISSNKKIKSLKVS